MSSSNRRVLWGGVGLVVVLAVVIQFIPTPVGPPNPAVAAEPAWDSPATRDMFYQACGDCHSNLTQWPWYSHVAPVSWLIARDVVEGRARLNVSEWNRPQRRADEAANAVLGGEMPLPIYLIMHPKARLTPAQRDALAKGLATTFGG
jgi:mono/diheme cytochrome c family protein